MRLDLFRSLPLSEDGKRTDAKRSRWPALVTLQLRVRRASRALSPTNDMGIGCCIAPQLVLPARTLRCPEFPIPSQRPNPSSTSRQRPVCSDGSASVMLSSLVCPLRTAEPTCMADAASRRQRGALFRRLHERELGKRAPSRARDPSAC